MNRRKNTTAVLLGIYFSILVSGAFFASSTEAEIAPEKEVKVSIEQQDLEHPAWKKLWDTARSLVRQKKFAEAKKSYQQLLAQKPNIVAAAWEYCKLLVTLGDWEAADRVVGGMLEYEPANLDFLLIAGKIALNNSHFSKAAQYYGQVLEADPVGSSASQAIAGLVDALLGLENKKGAYILLEQYYQRGVEDEAVIARLAKLSSSLGMYRKAQYYYAQLIKRFPQNTKYLQDSAELNELAGDLSGAAENWQAYLELQPNFLPFHKKLADYYLAKDKPELAVVHLKRIYQGESFNTALALQIADLYSKKLKRRDKALIFYEKYLRSYPENLYIQEIINNIRAELARQYLPLVENDAAETLWLDLDYITNSKAEIFLKIAEILREQGKSGIELGVVGILFEYFGTKRLDIVHRLADLQMINGNAEEAYRLFTLLDEWNYAPKEYLISKALIELQQKDEPRALKTYLKYLQHRPEDQETWGSAMELAGQLGLVSEIERLWNDVPAAMRKKDTFLAHKFKYIEALRENGQFAPADAVYTDIFRDRVNKDEPAIETYYHLADTLIQRGLFFRAEQLLRQNLAQDLDADRAIRKLIRISILQNQFKDASSWLALLATRRNLEDIEDNLKTLPEDIHFLRVEILLAQGDFDDAEQQILEHNRYGRSPSEDSEFKLKSDKYLARINYRRNDYQECLELIKSIKKRETLNQELAVLAEIVTRNIETDGSAADKVQFGSDRLSFSEKLEKAFWYENYQNKAAALKLVNSALEEVQPSVAGQIRKTDLLASMSRYNEALDVVNNLSERFPSEEYFQALQLKLQFQSGEFKEIVKKVPKETEDITEVSAISGIQGGHDMYFWKKLLLARALWAENRRDEAIGVYNSLLAVPVDTMFLERMEVEKINFNLPPLKKSFWNFITFSDPDHPDPIKTVMAPHFVAQNVGKPVDNLAANLYGKYRWQELVKKELSARKAVEQRDYYHAEKEYLSLLEEEKSQESLFDLANIYDRLGLYGKAGELYELMKERGPLYPGLDEYLQANVLKRQPRLLTSITANSRKGREGYINIRKRSFGAEGWFMPAYDQELSVRAYHNVYRAGGVAKKIRSLRLLGSYSTYFENITDLNIQFGSESAGDSGNSEILFKFELFQRLGDSVEVYGRFEQDLVEDTISSLADSVIYRDFETGIKYDLFPRWFLGGDYRHRFYSDDNQQNRYKLWTQYHLFGETNQWKVKYSYEYLRNEEGNAGRSNDFSNNFAEGDQPYWSPSKYWQQDLTLHFKHFFEKGGYSDELLNYCSLDYSYGYDNNRQQSHKVDFNIFLEISRHFLLKGNLSSESGDDYEEKMAAFALTYRW